MNFWGIVLAVVVGIIILLCLRVIVLNWAYRTLSKANAREAYEARLRRLRYETGPKTRAEHDAQKDAALDSLAARWRR